MVNITLFSILFYALLIALFLLSNSLRYERVSNADVNSIHRDFIEKCDSMGLDCSSVRPKVVVKFKDLHKSEKNPLILGMCETISLLGFFLERSVFIDSNSYKNLSKNQFRALLYHEFIHCYFNMEHYEELPDIMNSTILSEPGILFLGGPEKMLDIALERQKRY